MGYVYFTEEQKERANTVDLKDFLERQGERLLRSGPEWRMSSDHSITIRGNRWYDHGSAGKGGAAIDFVIYYYGKTFPDAVGMLLGGEQGQTYRQSRKQEEIPRKPFALPAANGDMRRVFAYLLRFRLLDYEVVSAFAKENLLYESLELSKDKTRQFHNAIFVGYDAEGKARHAHKKGSAPWEKAIGEIWRAAIPGTASTGMEKAVRSLYSRHPSICFPIFPCINPIGELIVMFPFAV